MSDLSPWSRSILEDGRRALDPTDGERRRMRAAIAARVAGVAVVAAPTTVAAASAGGATASTAAAAGSSSVAGILKLTLVASAIGAGGTATWVAVSADEPAPVEARAPVEPAAPGPIGLRGDRVAAPLVEPPPAPVLLPEATPAPTREKPAPQPVASEPSPARQLAEEVRLLAPARQAVRRGDPDAALSALDLYEEAHPDGQLVQEATLLRADALCQVGRSAEATRLLDRVRTRNPDAPGLAAVVASCERR